MNLARKILSVLILAVYLAPAFVSVAHHHEKFICGAKNESHFHKSANDCDICGFIFSTSNLDKKFSDSKIFLPEELLLNFYISDNCQLAINYTFLLRAPPKIN